MDDDWDGYVGQVRDRYFAHDLTPAQFEHDLKIAILLDEGILNEGVEIPGYLHDRFGLPLSPIDVT